MKTNKGYTLVGMTGIVSVLVVLTISVLSRLVASSQTAKHITHSEVNYTQDRADSILLTIRDSRGEPLR